MPPTGSSGEKGTTQYTRPYVWEYKYFIPTGETGDLLDTMYGYDSEKNILYNLGYPTSLKWGYYLGSWIDSGVQPSLNEWHNLKIIVNANGTFDLYSDNTLIVAGIASNYVPSQKIKFMRYSGKLFYIDAIRARKHSTAELTAQLGEEETSGDVTKLKAFDIHHPAIKSYEIIDTGLKEESLSNLEDHISTVATRKNLDLAATAIKVITLADQEYTYPVQ